MSTQSAQLYGQPTVTLYNVNTQVSTDLSTLPGLADTASRISGSSRWIRTGGSWCWPINPSEYRESDDLLLLTPAGVSSDPIIMNAPEPGSWAVMAMALAACAAHRARECRGRKAA